MLSCEKITINQTLPEKGVSQHSNYAHYCQKSGKVDTQIAKTDIQKALDNVGLV